MAYITHVVNSLIMQDHCLQDAGSGTAVSKQPSASDDGTSLASNQGPQQQLIAAQHGPVASTQQVQDLSPADLQSAAAVQCDHRRGDSLKPSLADASVIRFQPSQHSPPLLQSHAQSSTAVHIPPPEGSQGTQSVNHRAGFASSSISYQTPQVTQTAQSSQHVSSVTHHSFGETVSHSESQHTQSSAQETSASHFAGVLHNAGQERGTRAGQQQPYAVHAMQQSHMAEYTTSSSHTGNHSNSQTVRTSSSHSEFSFRSSVSPAPVFMPGEIMPATFPESLPCGN